MAAPPRPHFLFLLLLLFHLSLLHATPPPNDHPDLTPLMSFKASSDGSNKLTSWTYSSDPCNTSSAFYGVSCLHNRVTRLVLEDLELQGRFDSLTSLTHLRILSLKRNRLTGRILEGEKIVYSSSPYPNPNLQTGFERGKMVFFEGVKRFELEDLLRASAEMLGKGGFRTAYKAVLDDGNVVAVKRLKEAAIGGRREFEHHMEVLGMLRHPNVVRNRGPARTPLDWTTRLKVAAGAARGLVFIHHSCKSPKLSHGNLKSTNILLDKTGTACVSDFGLSAFAPPTTAPKSNGYRAPELLTTDPRKTTQKSDVYSFGVLLLELLTGKCPSVVDNGETRYGGAVDLPRWVQSVVREEWTAEVFDLELMRYKDIEEELVGLLQIALSCTAAVPNQRPTMGYVLKMIEEIRGVEVSPSHDMIDSVSDSPSVSDDTCRARQAWIVSKLRGRKSIANIGGADFLIFRRWPFGSKCRHAGGVSTVVRGKHGGNRGRWAWTGSDVIKYRSWFFIVFPFILLLHQIRYNKWFGLKLERLNFRIGTLPFAHRYILLIVWFI
ncbi:hypothetical protein L1987_06494 [Smallanthus sonchifolius]|uniref:Uncharacterized protein n=1 Tax=Smallanthus sonchifolius TaxID=185202 RepID=A0ACB9JYP0_9ASTR|nr:hypothetical protein L1987_06494 [Smallanthus sonchifolius]